MVSKSVSCRGDAEIALRNYRCFSPTLSSKLSAFTIHSLRHTFATTLAEKGVHPSTAQKMLGHSDNRMTFTTITRATDGIQDAATAALEETFS